MKFDSQNGSGIDTAEAVKRRLAAIVDSSDDAIISKDLNGIITSWNRGAEELFGFTAEEIIGKPVTTFIPVDRHHEERDILNRLRRGERIDHFETIRQRKNGELIEISLSVSPIRDASGKVIGASKIARDISLRKRSEEILRRHNELLEDRDQRKNEFLAMLGHELRNPLAAIRNAVQLLKDGADAPAVQWATQVIDHQTAQLSRLVDDLVDIARITSGQIHLRHEEIDIRPVIDRAIQTIRPLIAEREHALEVSLCRESLLASVDSSRLEQILVNLLTNAAKYTDPGGTIKLTAEKEGSELVIRVRDNGIGISAEALPHIWEAFVQDIRGLDRSRGGLGIGLALARRLTEMHKGTLTARSGGPGHGSEFCLRLPALVDPVLPAMMAPTQSVPIRSDTSACQRVLIVDDNQDSAQGLARLLAKRGFVVETAYDGPAAVSIACQFRPEAFLLDLGLPGITGYELAAELRQTGFTNALYIAISGYAQPRDRENSRREGFDYHFAKPVAVSSIVDALKAEAHPSGFSV